MTTKFDSSVSSEARTIIEEELRILEETLRSLEEQQERLLKSVSRETKRALALTAEIVATRRDEDKQLLASDEAVSHGMLGRHRDEQKRIEHLLKKPYFGRIVLEEERGDDFVEIHYKIGTAANPDCRIIDWRKAPLSKLYYEYKEGDIYSEVIQNRERDGEIKLRHTLDIAGGKLRRVGCRLGNFICSEGTWYAAGSGAAKLAPSEKQDVLGLITPEQFKLITEDAETSVLIQGIAGSGKTTVALHRLSWLVHEGKVDLTEEDCHIVVLNPVMKRYIRSLLPGLNLSGIKTETFEEWTRHTLKVVLPNSFEGDECKRPETPCSRSIARLKHSMAFLKSLESYVTAQQARLMSSLEQEIPWAKLPSGLQALFQANKSKGAPLALVEALLSGTARVSSAHADMQEALTTFREKLKSFERRLKLYREDIIRILENPQVILENDDTKLLDKALIEDARKKATEDLESDAIDIVDEALLVYLHVLKTGSPLYEGTERKAEHLVIDEVQDFSPLQLAATLSGATRLDALTVVGDYAQNTAALGGFPGWQKLREHWKLGDELAHSVTLNVSHRSTGPIIKFAGAIQGQQAPKGRHGEPPRWYLTRDEDASLEVLIDWINRKQEADPGACLAVLCRDDVQERELYSLLTPSFGATVQQAEDEEAVFDTGILLSTPDNVKGLEFTGVFLWNVSSKNYKDIDHDKNLLYVGATRAEEWLAMGTWRQPSVLLKRASAARSVKKEDLRYLDEEEV